MAHLIDQYPQVLLQSILAVTRSSGQAVHAVGGTVRDWLLDYGSKDLDLAVSSGGVSFCRQLVKELGGGTCVVLSGEEKDDTARVIWQGWSVDVSSYRLGAVTIEDDLAKRDFTINAMGVNLQDAMESRLEIVDPENGLEAIDKRLLCCCRNAFDDDPLRMLRGFRLQATHGLRMDNEALALVLMKKRTIAQVSAERIHAELGLIMDSENAAEQFASMASAGLLQQLFPELEQGEGVEQPDYHHLDVFSHALEALKCMEMITASPTKYFNAHQDAIRDFLDEQQNSALLKWAALFHDLGKPQVRSLNKKTGRVTFHDHDGVGREIFEAIAARYRWSKNETQTVANLIGLHMQPFHLSNLLREGKLTPRAVGRMARRAGEQLVGLFLLALSDSLASQGSLKPQNMEAELDQLFERVYSMFLESVQPVFSGEKILSGHDLISHFDLEPGPIFSKILNDLELARIQEKIDGKEQALMWVKNYLATQKHH